MGTKRRTQGAGMFEFELRVFRDLLAKLDASTFGKWVVIDNHGDYHIEDTYQSAARYASRRYKRKRVLIEQLSTEDEVGTLTSRRPGE